MQAAIRSDPYSVEARRLLAAERFRAFQAERTTESLSKFHEAVDEMLRLAPLSASTYNQAGQWYEAAYRQIQDDDLLSAAVNCQARAVELYPNRSAIRARYCVTLDLAGRHEEAAWQAAKALELDRITRGAGHTDKLLPQSLRSEVARIADAPAVRDRGD
jgi:hypothetical protein